MFVKLKSVSIVCERKPWGEGDQGRRKVYKSTTGIIMHMVEHIYIYIHETYSMVTLYTLATA